jgi:hypothetical protein
MTKVTPGLNDVAHPLLQFLGAGKAFIAFALPDQDIIDSDFEIAATAGKQRDLAQGLPKSAQKLLRHPSGPQQPIALRTIEDGNAGLSIHRCDLKLHDIDTVTQHFGWVNCLSSLSIQWAVSNDRIQGIELNENADATQQERSIAPFPRFKCACPFQNSQNVL